VGNKKTKPNKKERLCQARLISSKDRFTVTESTSSDFTVGDRICFASIERLNQFVNNRNHEAPCSEQ